MGDEPDGSGSFFGRRKGKQLRGGQADRLGRMLPGLRLAAGPAALRDAFPAGLSTIRLEIGFGGGEHLAEQARRNPQVGFIGVEPFVNGLVKLLAAVEADGLRNVRVWDDDAGLLLPAIPDGVLDRIYLLYPDPWPKRRQRKRRFLDDGSLAEMGRVLRPGGELRFATDIDDYAGWALVRVARAGTLRWAPVGAADWRDPWADWLPTRYEAKARREGRGSVYLTFVKP